MVYFDNAATGGRKPRQVLEAVSECLLTPANPGRSSHKRALQALHLVSDTREKLCAFFNAPNPDRVIFTKNCTEALNIALLGTVKKGGNILSSQNEHNSVLRPLSLLKQQFDIENTLLSPNQNGQITLEQVQSALLPNTYLVILSLASNVTGGGCEYAKIGAYLQSHHILFAVDAAQAAGHLDIDMKNSGIDILCVPAHKGLLAPSGLGVLLFANTVNPTPILYGGTGTESQNIIQPSGYPESLESGTLNVPAIAGLNAALNYLTLNRQIMYRKLAVLQRTLHEGLQMLPFVKEYSVPNVCGISSLLLDGLSSEILADTLSTRYEIAVRAGLHCAPEIHKHLGTMSTGLVRISLSPYNTLSEVNYLLMALREIHGK